MSQKEVANVLESLFEHIEDMGIEFSTDNKESIIDSMSKELGDDLTFDEMQKTDCQKQLIHTISSALLGDNKEYDSMLKKLKDDPAPEDGLSPEMKNKANISSYLLTKLSMLLKQTKENEKDNDPNKNPLIIMLMKMKKDLQQKLEPGKEKKQDNISELKSKAEQEALEATNRNLNGGDDPTVSGEIQSVIFVLVGDLVGVTNQLAANPMDESTLGKAITFDPGEHDPNASEIRAKAAELSQGVDPDDLRSISTIKPQGPLGVDTEG